MPKPLPDCRRAVPFVKARLGKSCFAPLTGHDWRVYEAFVHCAGAWMSADDQNRPHLENAMRELLQSAQPCLAPVAKQSIYAMGCESHMYELWPLIAPVIAPKQEAPKE